MELGNRIAAPAFVHTHKARWKEPLRAGLTIGADGKMAFNPPYYIADEPKPEVEKAAPSIDLERHFFAIGDRVFINDRCPLVHRHGETGVVVKPTRLDKVSVMMDDGNSILHVRATSLDLIFDEAPLDAVAKKDCGIKAGDRVIVNLSAARLRSARGVVVRSDHTGACVNGAFVKMDDGDRVVFFKLSSLDVL